MEAKIQIRIGIKVGNADPQRLKKRVFHEIDQYS